MRSFCESAGVCKGPRVCSRDLYMPFHSLLFQSNMILTGLYRQLFRKIEAFPWRKAQNIYISTRAYKSESRVRI